MSTQQDQCFHFVIKTSKRRHNDVIDQEGLVESVLPLNKRAYVIYDFVCFLLVLYRVDQTFTYG